MDDGERNRRDGGRERRDDERPLGTEPPVGDVAPERGRDEPRERRRRERHADLRGRETASVEHDRQERQDRRLCDADKGEQQLHAAKAHRERLTS